jgi:membrane fusion protein (multidrug efflux system)
MPATSETTDDAYVGADATVVAPKVKGLVAQVLVQDNQAVHAGDALVRIDPEEFDARVETAKAQLADAQAGIASAQAALVGLVAEQRLASANVRAAQAAILAAEAEAERASLDRERFASLAQEGAVAQREADTARAAAVGAEQSVARSTALYDVSRHTVSVTEARRATLEAALLKARAVAERAKAELDLAVQDQRHATVYAPIDGVVGNRQVQQGDYVQAGSRLLTLVPTRGFYVTANFKETQTGRMHPGQHARIRIDAFPGEDFDGTVQSIAPGSGSSFALLPFEPGTGNFTKIVQRIPVRIRFAGSAPSLEQLRPGLSVAAKVTLD